MTNLAVEAKDLGFAYGERRALDGVSFAIPKSSVHAFLGPNGSGKSTLFKILATILPLQQGSMSVLGLDLAKDYAAVRERIGVVFQSPALDRKLTIERNLTYAGHMYGLSGSELSTRIADLLARTGLADRRRDKVEELSGGLKRRVELAKGLLIRPELLILDEPTTGLDPGARRDLWQFLSELEDMTILVTTHLMDEAGLADGITILNRGKVVAQGTPKELTAALPAGAVLEVRCADEAAATALAGDINKATGRELQQFGHDLRLQSEDAHRFVATLMDDFAGRFAAVSLSNASLEDVFIQATGHRFFQEDEAPPEPKKKRKRRRA